MDLTFTQCKQLSQNYSDMREIIESLNSQPDWITQALDMADIQAVQQGGCASGAYMPAVTYHQAVETMAEHGDEVLEYLTEQCAEDFALNVNEDSWGGFAVKVLSMAVESWCQQFDLDGVNWD